MTRPAATLARLGGMPVAHFLSRYWHRHPLVLRDAISGFGPPIDRERLFALAADAEVESRLVTVFGGRWRLRQGPIPRRALPALRRPGWTLLVQGVDLHEAPIAALAARFRFLPAARFDDVMVSWASDGGGVGAHVDQYDVFLLQCSGHRRWRVARRFDAALRPGLPLRVLERFVAEEEWLLGPGDMLYLPPGVAHEGTAQGESITISIGFRLPAWQEIAGTWHERQERVAPLEGRLPDRIRAPTRTPARLGSELVDAAARVLVRVAPSRRDARRALLENLSEPKPQVVFDPPVRPLPYRSFRSRALRMGVRLDARTRFLYEGPDFAINGEVLEATPGLRAPLARLANAGCLPAARAGRERPPAPDGLLRKFYDWYCSGWLHLAVNEGCP
jgi:50S ribosomal protein L16 3-hydroxylase